MLLMFKLVIRVDQDIVQVSYIEVVKVVEEYIIYITLVSSKVVCKSKWNYLVLVTTISSLEYSKVFQSQVYVYIVKYLANVELGKDLCLTNTSQSLVK